MDADERHKRLEAAIVEFEHFAKECAETIKTIDELGARLRLLMRSQQQAFDRVAALAMLRRKTK